MVSKISIYPNTEVFNTYGETLDNAQLLAQYGFILDINENDYVAWDPNELYRFATALHRNSHLNLIQTDIERHQRLWRETIKHPRMLFEGLSESQLVYYSPTTATGACVLCINGDGKVSHQLWLFFALLSQIRRLDPRVWDDEDSGFGAVAKSLDLLADVLVDLEDTTRLIEEDVRDAHKLEAVRKLSLLRFHLRESTSEVGRSVMALCAARKRRANEVGFAVQRPGEDLGDMLDVSHTRTCFAVEKDTGSSPALWSDRGCRRR